METIDKEAIRQSRSPLNIDNFAERYKTSNNLYNFSSPSIWALEKNLYYLLYKSTKKEFDPKYKFKPSYLSYDEYDTVILDKVLMYVNNVRCAEEFNLDRVIIPELDAIIEICEDRPPQKNLEELSDIDW